MVLYLPFKEWTLERHVSISDSYGSMYIFGIIILQNDQQVAANILKC